MLPEISFIADDFYYWKRNSNDDPALIEIMQEQMKNVADGHRVLRRMLHGELDVPVPAIEEWYTVTPGILAWSRMWREVGITYEVAGQGVGAADTDWVVDIDAKYPHLSGLQGREADLPGVFGIERPASGEEVWLEGESVYLRVRYPAEPTGAAATQFAEHFDVPFPIDEFASVVPRLKAEFWPVI